MSIGQELLNVPMGDMIRQMAFAIADGQAALDAASINVAEMMGGLTTVYDEKGVPTFDDSRVFFGYEYMTVTEALAYAAIDDAFTGTFNPDETLKLVEVVKEVISTRFKKSPNSLTDEEKEEQIRVPVRHSMLELGFAPTFYQFIDTIIEVKIAIKITRTSEYGYGRSSTSTSTAKSASGGVSFWSLSSRSASSSVVTTSQVDASYSSKYSYSAEGASILRTKLVPVPVPAVLEDRIRSFMETEEELRRQRTAPAPVTPPTP